MKISPVFKIAFILFFAFLLIGSSVSAQEQKAEDLEKKYAPIIGQYEFDLSEFGQPNQTVEFKVENNALWIIGDDGEPGELEPVEGEEMKFSYEDPMQGSFIFTFIKDENGKYTTVTALIEMAGVEVTGTRIGDGDN